MICPGSSHGLYAMSLANHMLAVASVTKRSALWLGCRSSVSMTAVARWPVACARILSVTCSQCGSPGCNLLDTKIYSSLGT